MKYIGTLKASMLIIPILLLNLFATSHQSIVGVTYRDHFNFEERYRNVHECDPFYWHPLHMPEECANMYESLIRSRLPGKSHRKRHRYRSQTTDYYQDYIFDSSNDEYEYEYDYQVDKNLPPYERMLQYIKRDVFRHPTAPIIGNVPSLGPVAVYEQPISKHSEKLIKAIATMYAKAGKQDDDGYYFAKIDIKDGKNSTDNVEFVKNGEKLTNARKSEALKELMTNGNMKELMRIANP